MFIGVEAMNFLLSGAKKVKTAPSDQLVYAKRGDFDTADWEFYRVIDKKTMKAAHNPGTVKQSGLQDQKSVKVSTNDYKISKNSDNIFLTFRNHVKIFLSQDIMQNFKSVVYRKNLSIGTDRTDKTVKTLIRLPFEEQEQSDQGLHCLSFCLLHLHIILQRKLKLFNFRIFSILSSGVPILRGFHLNVC